jgi:hypothetical protein
MSSQQSDQTFVLLILLSITTLLVLGMSGWHYGLRIVAILRGKTPRNSSGNQNVMYPEY